MKRNLLIGFLCLFSLHSNAEYYYYHGEKVNININADSMVVYSPSKIRSGNIISSALKYYTYDKNCLIEHIKKRELSNVSIQ